MKVLKILPVLALFIIATSCSSVTVAVDYDKETNFEQYNTYAFYKPGIDGVEISDLDKRRILRAIDRELSQKGMIKSTNPDLLINIFTEAQENINIYQDNFGWGGGWGWGMPMTQVNTSVEGSLFIDFIDSKKNQLVWQGLGQGILSLDMEKKEERINEIVNEIIKRYPPTVDKK